MLTLALAAEAFARQQWQNLSDQAIQHVRRSEWKEAETKLLQSIKLGPKPDNRRRAIRRQGMLYDDFMPEYCSAWSTSPRTTRKRR